MQIQIEFYIKKKSGTAFDCCPGFFIRFNPITGKGFEINLSSEYFRFELHCIF